MALRTAVSTVVFSVGLLAARSAVADCGCSGNPGNLTSDATGPCLRYPAPSGAANDITFRFADAYGCGTYATGEYFVTTSGTASVTAISPDASSGRHGFDVNPSPTGPQRWDNRLANYAAPPSLPYAAVPGSSIIKYVSDNPSGSCDGPSDEKSCGRFAAVVTVVNAPPANPSHTFRPPFVGTYKAAPSTDELKTALLSRLDRGSCAAPSLATARAWTSHLRLDYTSDSVICDLMPPEDALPDGRPWSTDIWANDTDVYAWLELANVCAAPPCTPEQDLQTKLPVLIGYVQHGIDIWGVDKMGASMFRGGGGNGGGKLFAYTFAGAMLGNADMLADLAAVNATHFFETASYYTGRNGAALWGQPTGSEKGYWDDFASKSTRTIRDPYGLIDGGFEPGGWYQDNTAKPTQYSALLMRLTPAFQSVWPINKDALLKYADRWVAHGALATPDACAPINGTYGQNYGPDGKGGCIAGSGRVPSLDGNNKNGGNRQRPIGECMWTRFRACAENCSCAGQSCPGGADGGSGTGGASGSGGAGGNGGVDGGGGGAGAGGNAGSGRGGAAGLGGASGMAGTAGSAGAVGGRGSGGAGAGGAGTSGGSAGSGGSSVGGNAGAAGQSGGGGVAGISGSAGASGTVGGGGATSGAAGNGPRSGDDGGGCGCRMGRSRTGSLSLLAVLFLAAHRRRRRAR